MCKLLLVVGSKHPAKIKMFMDQMLVPMSICNAHGAGYTAVRKDGTIFTERWLDNSDALKGDPRNTNDSKMAKKFGDLIDVVIPPKDTYSCQGEPSWGDVTSVIMHTRYATCDKTFDNVHPFVDNKNITSIAHNGMISNHKKFNKLNSTCDSEVFLTEYNKRKIGSNPNKVVNMIEDFSGYWALASTTLDDKDKRVIDVFTSNKTGSGSLVVAYIKELDGYVFASSAENVKTAISKLDWDKNFTIHTVLPHVFARFDAITGKTLETIKYGDKMESYQVEPSRTGGQTRNHTISKKNEKDRRLLPPPNNHTCAYGAGHKPNSVGTTVYGSVGSVATFYDKYNNKKTITSKSNTLANLSNSEQKALDRWARGKGDGTDIISQEDAIDNHPSNFMKSSAFDDKLSNFIEGHEATDSKYYKNVLDEPLDEAEIEELEEFSKSLARDEQEILDGLPFDMKLSFLSTLNNEEVG